MRNITACEFQVGERVVCFDPPQRWETGESERGGCGWKDKMAFTIGKITEVQKNYDNNKKTLYVLWPEKEEGINDSAGVYCCYARRFCDLPNDLFEIS